MRGTQYDITKLQAMFGLPSPSCQDSVSVISNIVVTSMAVHSTCDGHQS